MTSSSETTTQPVVAADATETTTPPTSDWRARVYLPDSYTEDAQDFLDKYTDKGTLSKTGNFRLLEPIGVSVPYELCPPRVKHILQKITVEGELPRSAFPRASGYHTALICLHTYGYLKDLDSALIARKAARRKYHRKWQRSNKDKMKQYNRNAKRYRMKWRSDQIELKTLSAAASE
jgi:hypothetical protein